MTCFIVSLVLCAVLAKGYQPRTSPDGAFYLTRPNVRPYCTRRLLPAVLRSPEAWRAVSFSCTVVTATMTGLYCGSAWASALVLGLPVLRQAFFFPVLTDPAGLMLLSTAYATGRWEIAAIGGLFNEKCPIFGAFLSPWALVGLIPAVVLYLAGEKPRQNDPEWLKHPLKEGWKKIGRLAEPKISVLPWGGALLGAPNLDLKGWACIGVGYGQLMAAQDSARLYMYAFLPLVRAVEAPLLPLAALLCWVNPDRDRI